MKKKTFPPYLWLRNRCLIQSKSSPLGPEALALSMSRWGRRSDAEATPERRRSDAGGRRRNEGQEDRVRRRDASRRPVVERRGRTGGPPTPTPSPPPPPPPQSTGKKERERNGPLSSVPRACASCGL